MRNLTIIEIILVFIVPVYIIYKSPFFYKNRQWIFGPILLIIGLLMFFEKYTLYKLGFRSDNIIHSLLPYFIFTFSGIGISILISNYLDKKPVKNWWRFSHFHTDFITLSFLQELIYRGYLMPKLETIFHSVIITIILNSLIFAFIHIIYPNKLRNFLLSFVAGLFFATIYYFYPNLYLITISHSALNFVTLLYGIIGPNDFKDKQILC